MLGENCCRVGRCSAFLFLCLFPVLLPGCGSSDLKFPTEYQAVFLDTGQVFFGRLSGDAGSPYLTLRDVFYVKQQLSPDKKEAHNLLVKRGSEWHGPDFMRISSRHVVLIEPVAPDSRVARLIPEAKAGSARGLPAAPPQEEKPVPEAAAPKPQKTKQPQSNR